MYLKNITLRGFKSFAKKSQLIFEPGVSVIVGPNGSGKSNIADALSWVMGTQSAKSLRASSMEDVIFKSRNEEFAIAEVSLLFDNKDRFLPLDFSEVKFTRRVFQKGGSEYFINSAPARLIDILDLTAEKGIGKGLYTIVNQGQIDELAVLKPLERKFIVDEILGISKHKARRSKSKSKLVKVSSDIERISDLMLEVKRTLDPLEIESKKAQKYFEVLTSLKEEEMSLFIADISLLNSDWENENSRHEECKIKSEGFKKDIENLENEIKDFRESSKLKQELFESLKNKIEYFSDITNQFENMSAMAQSKTRIFNVLSGMFSSQYDNISSTAYGIKHDTAEAASIVVNKNEAYEKLLLLQDSFEDILNRMKNIGGIDALMRLAESHYIQLKETVKYFNEVLDVDEKTKYSARDHDADKTSDLNPDKKDLAIEKELVKNLEKIRMLKDYCDKKIKESDRFLLIVSNLDNMAKTLKKNIFTEFDQLLNEINEYNSRENEFLRKINDLNLKKQGLDNELYKIDFRIEQIREKVKNITDEIIENYNLPVEYIFKNYKPADDIEKSKRLVKKLKYELKSYGSVNPNATSEYKIVKERYDFLENQQKDLVESRTKLEELIQEINLKIEEMFVSRFDEININFNKFFKSLFPLGNGEMILIKTEYEGEKDYGIDLKVDIGNSKMVQLSLLSGGEKALVSIAFLFSVFALNYSPFYVFDEIDASLDDMNLSRFVTLVKQFSEKRQIIIITHQKKTMEIADTIYGVTMQSTGMSKIVSEKMTKKNAEIN